MHVPRDKLITIPNLQIGCNLLIGGTEGHYSICSGEFEIKISEAPCNTGKLAWGTDFVSGVDISVPVVTIAAYFYSATAFSYYT